VGHFRLREFEDGP